MAMPATSYAANNELLAKQACLQLAVDNCKLDNCRQDGPSASEKVDLPPFYRVRRSQSAQAALLWGEKRSRLTAQYKQFHQKNAKTPQVLLPKLTPVNKPSIKTLHSNKTQHSKPSHSVRYPQACRLKNSIQRSGESPIWLSELGVCTLLLLPYLLIAS